MNTNFALGGAVAALVIIAGLGIWLFRSGFAIRDGLAPYVGASPARWMVWFLWTGYVLGALQAVASTVQMVSVYAPEAQPSAVQFLLGLTTGPILEFASWATSFVQIGALLLAVVVVSRVLREET